MSPLNIAIRYTAFALVATVVNLLTQELSLAVYQAAFALVVAMFAGTATGLITKYFLDKLYIFNHVSSTKNARYFYYGPVLGIRAWL
jgi:putative flippase GtrA